MDVEYDLCYHQHNVVTNITLVNKLRSLMLVTGSKSGEIEFVPSLK